MKKDNHIEDQIDRYIRSQMSPKEKLSFEQSLSEDRALFERLENEMLIKLNIKRYHRKKIKEQLKEIHAKTVHRKSKLKIYLLLVALIVLSMFAFFYVQKKHSISNQDLYAKYYTKYTIDFDQRNVDEATLDEIYKHYKNESFNEVINKTEVFNLKSIPTSYRLILGISYLELNNLERAKLAFQSIIDEQDVIFYDQALWYKALAELKSNNVNEAKNLLVEIAKDEYSDHFDDANKLLNSLVK